MSEADPPPAQPPERSAPGVTRPALTGPLAALDEAAQHRLVEQVVALLHAGSSRDFRRYKRTTVLRRVQRRMQLRQVVEPATYLALLHSDLDEVRTLADDILITVTRFFRDAETFEQLEAHVLPQLFERKEAGTSIRAWSVGCATGEEAYSLAVLLLEAAGRRAQAPGLWVLGTDIHERALQRARSGLFSAELEADVSAERRERFFRRETGGYRVRDEVRRLVRFLPHNLLDAPPCSNVDLVSCRNVLIYLQRDVQQAVIQLLHAALAPGGFLVLGKSETVENAELFRPERKRHSIFRKRQAPGG